MMILEDNVASLASNLNYTEGRNVQYDKADFLDDSFGCDDADRRGELIRQFASRHSTGNKAKTLVFSCSPGEKLTNETWKDIITYSLHKFGYQYSAYIAVRHVDTAIDHIHVTLSRVDLDGKILRSSFSHNKCKLIARELEQVFNLAPFEAKFKEKKLSRREYQAQKHGYQTNSGYMRDCLDKALERSFCLDDLEFNLKEYRIETRVKYNEDNPIGISYFFNGQATSGGKLGYKYKISTVLSKIDDNWAADFDEKPSIELEGKTSVDFLNESIKQSANWNEFVLNLKTRELTIEYRKKDGAFVIYQSSVHDFTIDRQNALAEQLILWFRKFLDQQAEEEERLTSHLDTERYNSLPDSQFPPKRNIPLENLSFDQELEEVIRKSRGMEY